MAEFNKYIKHKNLDYTSCSSLPAEADSAEGEEDEPSSKRLETSHLPQSLLTANKNYLSLSRVCRLL